MPRYFFTLYNDEILKDEVGQELDGLEGARQAAARSISELVAEQIVIGKKVNLRHRVEIQTGDGQIIATVRFGDFFYVKDEGTR